MPAHTLDGLPSCHPQQDVSTCWAVLGGPLINGSLGWGVGSRHATRRMGPDPYCPCRIPTASMWGAVGAVGLVWATDWRLILDWVPYINGKFKKED